MTSNRRTASSALFDCSRPIAVEADVGMARAQRRPFGERLLDPAFAEIALAGGDQRLDLLGAAGLADGDQRDVGRIAARELAPRRRLRRVRMPSPRAIGTAALIGQLTLSAVA